MLILHANWTEGTLGFWAESVEAFDNSEVSSAGQVSQRATMAQVSSEAAFSGPGGVAVAGESAILAHPYLISSEVLHQDLIASGMVLDEDLDVSWAFDLMLPGDGDGPWPSDRLAGYAGVAEPTNDPELVRTRVEGVALHPQQILETLLRLESWPGDERFMPSQSVRYWSAVARLVVDLLVDQRFIPTMYQLKGEDLRAGWHPWLHDDEARSRVGALIAAMPTAVRSVCDGHEHSPWQILEEALRYLTNLTIRAALISEEYEEAIEDRDPATDSHVAWLAGLLGREDIVIPPPETGLVILRLVKTWVGALDERGQDLPLHLCFKLDEPTESPMLAELQPIGDEVTWFLSFHLQSPEEPDVLISAEQLWDKRGGSMMQGLSVERPQELFLAELGRASRMYSRIEHVLSEASPTGMSLTTSQAYEFLSEIKPLLEESGFAVIAPSWWGDPSAQIGARMLIEAPQIEEMNRTPSELSNDTQKMLGLETLVHYQWKIAIGDQPLSMEEFHALAEQRLPLVRLRGRWVEISPKQIAEAAKFLDSRPGGEMPLLEAIRMAHGSEDSKIGLRVSGLDATGWVADLLGASGDEKCMPTLKQPENFLGELRPYQKIGLSWMAFLDRFGLGACLADDMGLGKTIQMIALLLHERLHVKEGQKPGPTLLIVPTSLLGNWSQELDRFSPTLTYHVNHGPERTLDEAFEEIARTHDLILTTYGLVSRDQESLNRIAWHRVVLDEAQYIKNPPTKQTIVIRSLNAARRVALTGTPVENRLAELWSIMEFLNPGYLGTAGEFKKRFAIPIERHRDQIQADRLRQLIQPFVLRRLKTDPKVISDLPACVETKEYAMLTTEQVSLYENTVNTMLSEIDRSDGIQRRGIVLATLVKLKQICNHPALIAKETTNPGEVAASGTKKRKRRAAVSLANPAEFVSRSGKCRRIKVMLEEVLAVGERALIFTQFRQMGHLLTAMIQHELNCEVIFLHGGTPMVKRQQMINRFNDPEEGPSVFVLSLKAGGVGLNLTAANHVFHFDRWWNPAVENQATDRAFRIGQTRTVHVHKFVCTGTLEERIDQMIEQKTKLADNIIGSGEQWLTELGTGQLRDILTLQQSAMGGES